MKRIIATVLFLLLGAALVAPPAAFARHNSARSYEKSQRKALKRQKKEEKRSERASRKATKQWAKHHKLGI
jgi:uncharacterized membrane-anchored protein